MYRVLVVEDDPIMTKLLASVYKSGKFEVFSAATVKSGLETAFKELPDLILSDVYLPDGNGVNFCRQLKTEPRLRHIPVILLTGDAVKVEDRVYGMESGAEDYILKPFIPEEILARTAAVIKRSLDLGK